jgi:hypothetical protein
MILACLLNPPRLSQILFRVLRDLYSIRTPSMPERLSLTQRYTADLHAWRRDLARFLDAPDLPSSLLIPIYQRQKNVLNLAYYHAMLLVHRPFLLSSFAALKNHDAPTTTDNTTSSNANPNVQENIQQCLDAAMGIVRVVDEMNNSQIFRAFWFTQYYAFCAVVVLYVYRIQQHISRGKCAGYYTAGQRCQAVLNSISETDCLSKRYCLVLEELRLEAAKHRCSEAAATAVSRITSPTKDTSPLPSSYAHSAIATNSSATLHPPTLTPQSDASPAFTNTYYTDPNNPLTPDSMLFNTNFLPTSNIMADLTSWGQFDSLVTAGIGMLDGGGFQEDGTWGFGFGM